MATQRIVETARTFTMKGDVAASAVPGPPRVMTTPWLSMTPFVGVPVNPVCIEEDRDHLLLTGKSATSAVPSFRALPPIVPAPPTRR